MITYLACCFKSTQPNLPTVFMSKGTNISKTSYPVSNLLHSGPYICTDTLQDHLISSLLVTRLSDRDCCDATNSRAHHHVPSLSSVCCLPPTCHPLLASCHTHPCSCTVYTSRDPGEPRVGGISWLVPDALWSVGHISWYPGWC